jgi:uncharacterized protein YpiB (UPF0302 family)
MPKRKKLYVDPKFHEWCYALLSSLTVEQKSMLNHRELAKIRTPSAINAFINNASEAQMEVFLTKTGVECNRVYVDHKNFDPELVKRTYRQYNVKDLAGRNIQEMVERKIFVTDSRPIAISLAMMSLNCHSSAYEFNTGFLKTNDKLKGIRKRMQENNVNRQFQAFQEGYQAVRQLMLFGLTMQERIKGKWDLMPADLTILFIHASFPNNYVSTAYIKRNCAYKPAVVEKRCAVLFRDKQYLDKMPARQDTPSYRITDAGILVVGTLVNEAVNTVKTEQ